MTQQARKKLLDKYVHLLQLSPPVWEKIQLSEGTKLTKSEIGGSCVWFPEHRTAQVTVLPPEKLAKYEIEWEFVLVHELLHLLLEGHLLKPRPYDPQYERGLNILAAALTKKNKT